MSILHPGHYLTLLEYIGRLDEPGSVTAIDNDLPSLNGAAPKMCKHGCKHVIFSDAGLERHNRLAHMK